MNYLALLDLSRNLQLICANSFINRLHLVLKLTRFHRKKIAFHLNKALSFFFSQKKQASSFLSYGLLPNLASKLTTGLILIHDEWKKKRRQKRLIIFHGDGESRSVIATMPRHPPLQSANLL
jgi:hypothetical protein